MLDLLANILVVNDIIVEMVWSVVVYNRVWTSCFIPVVSWDEKRDLEMAIRFISFIKPRLADLLTLSRVIIALIIISLAWLGPAAYLSVVILVLVGAVTDIFDGRVARRYLDEGREGRLGKYDLDVDTFFVLCIVGYLAISGIVPGAVGLGWVGLALIAAILFKRNTRVMLLIEVPSVIVLLVIALFYDLPIFIWIIAPAMAAGIIFNYKRLIYVVFHYWPRVFSR